VPHCCLRGPLFGLHRHLVQQFHDRRSALLPRGANRPRLLHEPSVVHTYTIHRVNTPWLHVVRLPSALKVNTAHWQQGHSKTSTSFTASWMRHWSSSVSHTSPPDGSAREREIALSDARALMLVRRSLVCTASRPYHFSRIGHARAWPVGVASCVARRGQHWPSSCHDHPLCCAFGMRTLCLAPVTTQRTRL
jgi:hypothetical protein